MTGLRGGDHHIAAPVSRLNTHTVVFALATALAIVLAVLVLVLASSGGGSDSTEPVRVAPTSGPTPPSALERHQPPDLAGPGMRP